MRRTIETHARVEAALEAARLAAVPVLRRQRTHPAEETLVLVAPQRGALEEALQKKPRVTHVTDSRAENEDERA